MARFINGRHRAALLAKFLDVIPMSLTESDVASRDILSRISDRRIDLSEVISLPNLPVVEAI